MSNPAQELHNDIIAYIEKADALLAGGEYTSLVGLDTAVDTLCKRVLALGTEEATQFMPQLEQLVARLDALQKNMQTALDACKEEVAGLDKHRKAADAYNKKGKK